MTEPVVDYSLRAANQPRPADWVEPDEPRFLFTHAVDEGLIQAASGLTFWADVSIYQPVINSSYPYPVFGFRADSGGSTDGNAAANWAYCDAHPDRIRVAIPYVIFKPGQSGQIFSRLKNLFGSQCPPRVVPEVDMESGSGFAGPGDHSAEANDFVETLAGWSGKQVRTQGYANSPDWQGNWPSPPSWMKRRLANYSADPLPPGYYCRQYYGALPYPSPAGYPRSCAPFGSYVDMNVTPRSITQIETDYGITSAPEVDMTPEEHATLMKIAEAVKLDTTHPGVPSLGEVWRLANADTNDKVHEWTNASIAAKLEAVQTQLESVQQALSQLGTGTGGAVTRSDVVDIINSTQLHTGS